MAGLVLNSSSVFQLNFSAKLKFCASISATSPSREPSNVELDKSLIDTIIAKPLLKEEDRKNILNTFNAVVRDAKARSAYALL